MVSIFCGAGGDREHCIETGMNDYVSKPIDRQELLATIERWVAVDKLPDVEVSRTASGRPADGSAPVDSFKEPRMLPVIDVDDALDRVGGNESLLIRVISIFHKTYGNIIPEIRAALEGGDIQEAFRKVHTLKGVAGSLSARALFETARELETSLRNGDESGREELLSLLDLRVAAAKAFAAEIERSQNLHPSTMTLSEPRCEDVPKSPPAAVPAETHDRPPDANRPGDPDPPAVQAQLARLLTDLVMFIREYDPVGSGNTLASIASVLSGKGRDSILEIIAGRLSDYDFEGALPEVEELARAVGVPPTP
jgi:HPt (histidine-containing phosphotransfer) domain-containing protein